MKALIRGIMIAAAFGLMALGVVEAAPGPSAPWTKPNRPDAAGAKQVGVESPGGLSGVERVEMKLQHSCFQAPAGGAYSHSVVARTNEGYTLHWGVIVLGADANNAACPQSLEPGTSSMGWGRTFIVVRDSAGALVYSNLSRAGQANPPPAASSTSGGSPDGYVFAIRRVSNTWKFYFDGILKGQYNAPGNRISQVYALAESTDGAFIDDRVFHIALRAWPKPNGANAWWEPEGRALYNLVASTTCDDADIAMHDNVAGGALDLHWAIHHSLRVGDFNSGDCNYDDFPDTDGDNVPAIVFSATIP